MMKLVLIFRSLFYLQAFLVRRTYFISVETAIIFLFCKYYQVENRLEQREFLKERVMYELRDLVFLCKSGPVEHLQTLG